MGAEPPAPILMHFASQETTMHYLVIGIEDGDHKYLGGAETRQDAVNLAHAHAGETGEEAYVLEAVEYLKGGKSE